VSARLVAVLALAALCGCARIPMAEPKLDGPYGQELARDTRHAAIYQALETRLFLHMVWLKPELVTAQAQRLAEMRAEPPELAAAHLKKLQDESALPTFYAFVYTPQPGWNDWDAKSSVWRIALEGPAGEATPVKVQRFDGPFNAELMALYPYLDEFVTAYRLQFPAGSLGPSAKLLLAGALGKVELDWSAAGE
jgi:hypothetical protein